MPKDLFSNVSEERKRGSPLIDSLTNIKYSARNQAYQALAKTYNLDPTNQYGWYMLCRMFPGRFRDDRTGNYIDKRGSPSIKKDEA